MSESGGVPGLPVSHAPHSHNPGVDGARDAILELDVDLWHVEVLLVISKVFLDVPLGRSVHHVSQLESLDCLVLWHHSSAVGAPHNVGVTPVLLAPSIISPLRWHLYI